MSSKIIDLIKTILIYILTGTMLASAGYYINARQNAGQRDEVPWEKRRIFEGRAVFSEIDGQQLNPVQITVTFGGASRTAVHDDNLIESIYDGFIITAISGLFNRSAQSVALGGAEGAELWRQAAASENSLYIRYAGDYIHPIIYAFLNPDNYDGTGEGRAIVRIHELFIVDMDPVFGIARDSDGNIVAFMPSDENRDREIIGEHINATLQRAYNISVGEGIPCRFLNNNIISGELGANRNNIENLSFIESFHLFDNNHAVYSPVLLFENPLLDEAGNINLQQEYIRSLFRLLNFNRESAYFSQRRQIYTGVANSEVRFIADRGQIIYTHRSSTGGLHLARFLGYDADYYTFFEKLRAASAFANSLSILSRELVGGADTRLVLKDIFYENGDLTVIFAYYFRGVEIRIAGMDGAVILRISRDRISEVTINTLRVSLHEIIRNIDPMLILRETDRRIGQDISDILDYGGAAMPDGLLEELAARYNLSYDKDSGKLLVNRLELVYNIDYSGGSGISEPVWVIR